MKWHNHRKSKTSKHPEHPRHARHNNRVTIVPFTHHRYLANPVPEFPQRMPEERNTYRTDATDPMEIPCWKLWVDVILLCTATIVSAWIVGGWMSQVVFYLNSPSR